MKVITAKVNLLLFSILLIKKKFFTQNKLNCLETKLKKQLKF